MDRKDKKLKDLYKEYSKHSLSNLEIRRKIKSHIYNEELESDIKFVIKARKYIASFQRDILHNKTQLNIEDTLKKILEDRDYLFGMSPYRKKKYYERIEFLNSQIREIENRYNAITFTRGDLIFKELKRRGYKITKILE